MLAAFVFTATKLSSLITSSSLASRPSTLLYESGSNYLSMFLRCMHCCEILQCMLRRFFPSKALQCYMSSCRHGVFFNILEGCSEDMTFWRGQINMNQPRIRLLQQNKSWDQRSLLLHRSTSASKRWCRWNRTIQARRFQHELKHKAVRLPGTAMESLYRHPHLCALGQLPNRATLSSYSGRSRCRDSG